MMTLGFGLHPNFGGRGNSTHHPNWAQIYGPYPQYPNSTKPESLMPEQHGGHHGVHVVVQGIAGRNDSRWLERYNRGEIVRYGRLYTLEQSHSSPAPGPLVRPSPPVHLDLGTVVLGGRYQQRSRPASRLCHLCSGGRRRRDPRW